MYIGLLPVGRFIPVTAYFVVYKRTKAFSPSALKTVIRDGIQALYSVLILYICLQNQNWLWLELSMPSAFKCNFCFVFRTIA